MGLMCHVRTINAMASRLRRLGMPVPDGPSRNPTPREVCSVLDSMAEYVVRYELAYDKYWCAWLRDAASGTLATLVHLDDVTDEEHESPLWFENGETQLLIRITEQLTHRCGTLLLTGESAETPLVVTPGCDVETVLQPWRIPRPGWRTDL